MNAKEALLLAIAAQAVSHDRRYSRAIAGAVVLNAWQDITDDMASRESLQEPLGFMDMAKQYCDWKYGILPGGEKCPKPEWLRAEWQN